VVVLLPETAQAEINSGDTAWMLTASALVLLMTPGLALFYGGMVRAKNVLSTLMHSFFAMGIMSIHWVVIGYSLSFAEGNSFIGGFDYVLLNGVDSNPGPYADNIPHNVFMIFQMMFAIITPALISGAFAERIKFSGYVLFSLLWATLVYNPVCHWVWGSGGWLGGLGALDFAGGTVVHINSGVAALAVVLVLGRRVGYPQQGMKPHNLGLTVLGAGMLWFGWFGFNAGSALAADGSAANAFVVTHIAAAVAAVTWALIESMQKGKASALGVATGAVAGLVAITPACGFVGVGGAILIGIGAGGLCYAAIMAKSRFGYDDSLDVFGVHGIGGAWGALATGVFAVAAIGGTAGLLESGNLGQLGIQATSVLATAVYSFVVTFLIARFVDATVGLRVNEEQEMTGLDLSEHGEVGYNLSD
jgi:Amt family ammonium transporter